MMRLLSARKKMQENGLVSDNGCKTALWETTPGRAVRTVVSDNATFEEVIENAPGNFYMRSRFLLRRLQEVAHYCSPKVTRANRAGLREDPARRGISSGLVFGRGRSPALQPGL